MKKLLVVVAVLFATTVLFAQQPQSPNCIDCDIVQVTPPMVGSGSWDNVNDIDQTGDWNDAQVLQEGAGNYSKVDQDGLFYFWGGGYGNLANVSQQGASNHSDIDQNGNDNTGNVNQIGWRNYTKQVVGKGYAEHNIANSTQVGYDNIAYQNQRKDNNLATISQAGLYSHYGSRNYAIQTQYSGWYDAGNIAEITQRGDDNEAEQTQNGSNNNAYAFQQGTFNTSVENQTSVAGGSVLNDSDVYQYGYSNKVCINQDAIGANNMSYVIQNGNWNTALVDQTATASAMGNNDSDVNQNGWNNNACVTQYNQNYFVWSN